MVGVCCDNIKMSISIQVRNGQRPRLQIGVSQVQATVKGAVSQVQVYPIRCIVIAVDKVLITIVIDVRTSNR